MAPPRQFDGPDTPGETGPSPVLRGESLGPDAEALDRTLDDLLAGDSRSDPTAAAVRRALVRRVPPEKAARQLASIRRASASPERHPDPGRRPARDIIAIDRGASRRGRRRAAVAVLAAVMLLTLGSGSALAAAAGTMPGDALYGLKRTSERIALTLRFSPESKAALHLRLAERRIDEIDALAAAGKDVTVLVSDFAEELEAAALDAQSGATLTKLLERTRKHIAHLNEILAKVPTQAQEGIEKAIENAERHQERAEQKRIEKQQKKDGSEAPGKSGDTPGKKKGK